MAGVDDLCYSGSLSLLLLIILFDMLSFTARNKFFFFNWCEPDIGPDSDVRLTRYKADTKL
jgi:hypothetical protein